MIAAVRAGPGTAVLRNEDLALLTGAARFLPDLRFGQVHAAFVRSTVASARLGAIRTERALAAPGVVAVATGADLGLRPLRAHLSGVLSPAFTRTESMQALFHGRAQVQYAELGLRVDGCFVGLRARLVADAGGYPMIGALIPSATLRMLPGPYGIKEIDSEAVAVATTTTPVGAYRGAGRPEACALLERIIDMAAGNPLTSNLADYAVPSAADLPAIEVHTMETPTPRNPLGAKGIGQGGAIGATPAVQNAVVDALLYLGVRHIDLPLTPQRVWEAISNASKATGSGREPSYQGGAP